MLKSLVEKIQKVYSGQAAKDDVAAVIRHHRIQASPGYRAAAFYVLEELRRAGLQADMESYRADYSTSFWDAGSFQEWDAQRATLYLTDPAEEARLLCDYRSQKLSLIQRSASYKGRLEVVMMEDGSRETDYEERDVKGKLVLTNGDINRVRQLAVDRFGAAGILFDGMRDAPPVRESMDLPDSLQYTSFWWTGRPEETMCFGFVLSPRQGAWLRKLIHKQEEDNHPPVMVEAEVDTRLYDGEIEVVSALIPGQSREKVLLVSHLCHPQPSANDNASGVAANLEAARTLQRLIDRGELARPRRTIQFLWMPEMTGSYAYLSRHEQEIPDMIAGLNLDMVGEDQAQTGSVLVLERPPDASASFAPDLVERLRAMVFNDVKSYTGMGGYSLFRMTTTPFAGGSDHYIFSDPTVGVPMPMLNQWPDKFYHTSSDTLDKVSAESLARAGTLASAYVYFLANAGQAETTWLAQEMATRFQARLSHQVQDWVTSLWDEGGEKQRRQDFADIEKLVNYSLERHHEALRSLGRLWDGAGPLVEEVYARSGDFAKLASGQARQAVKVLAPGAKAGLEEDESEENGDWARRAATIRPIRLYRGPNNFSRNITTLSAEDQASWFGLVKGRWMTAYTVNTLAEYWADGRRSAQEIAELVEMETGIHDPELIVSYFEILRKLGLVDFKDGD